MRTTGTRACRDVLLFRFIVFIVFVSGGTALLLGINTYFAYQLRLQSPSEEVSAVHLPIPAQFRLCRHEQDCTISQTNCGACGCGEALHYSHVQEYQAALREHCKMQRPQVQCDQRCPEQCLRCDAGICRSYYVEPFTALEGAVLGPLPIVCALAALLISLILSWISAAKLFAWTSLTSLALICVIWAFGMLAFYFDGSRPRGSPLVTLCSEAGNGLAPR